MADQSSDLNDVSNAWNKVTDYIHPCSKSINQESLPTEFFSAVETLKEHEISDVAKDWFFEVYQKELREKLVPEFWSYFADKKENDLFVFPNAIHYLHCNIERCSYCLKPLTFVVSSENEENKLKDHLLLLLKAVLFSQLPLNYEEHIKFFYSKVFKVYHKKQKPQDDEEDGNSLLDCFGCGLEVEVCQCQIIWQSFQTVNQQLYELGLLEQLGGNATTFITHIHIEEHVQNICKGNFEESFLKDMEDWLERVVVKWLSHVYYGDDNHNRSNVVQAKSIIQNFKMQLSHFLYETYASNRMEELFDIIIEFPESQPAIIDLRECLEKTSLRPKLIETLKTAFETRLLHPGVNTCDVLTAYISAIKALRVLDSTGVILQLVCEPLRKYLKTREDTVRWIVISLTDDSSNELSDELIKGEPLLLDEMADCDDEMEDWENWQPDPVDADPTKTSKSRKSSDIISTLVNIYGSKEWFVREYRTLLADRILSQLHYDTQKELRYMELLKLRFGESELHLPEVMLKDVIDSKRINAHIHSENAKSGADQTNEFQVNAMVLSERFWPSFNKGKLELPAKIQEALDVYTKSFEALKGNRTLQWKTHLGLVNLQIELENRVINMNVSPIHATIIMHFETKSKWTIEELSSVMKVPCSVLRRKMAFWQSQGLVKEESQDTFVLLKEQKGHSNQDVAMAVDDDEEIESAMASSHDQREEVLQVCWSYIVGMLTNLESLPLVRIHTMLKMFAVQGPTVVECSIDELKYFLDRKVKEQNLMICGDLYRLPKS